MSQNSVQTVPPDPGESAEQDELDVFLPADPLTVEEQAERMRKLLSFRLRQRRSSNVQRIHSPKSIPQHVMECFELVGGLPRLAIWANDPVNYPLFLQIWARLAPKEQAAARRGGEDGSPIATISDTALQQRIRRLAAELGYPAPPGLEAASECDPSPVGTIIEEDSEGVTIVGESSDDPA